MIVSGPLPSFHLSKYSEMAVSEFLLSYYGTLLQMLVYSMVVSK